MLYMRRPIRHTQHGCLSRRMIRKLRKACALLLLLLLLLLAACGAPEQVQVPDDFSFVFSYGVMNKNVLHTGERTFTKDLVADGVQTTELVLSEEQMALIYAKMQEIELFDYPSEIAGTNVKPASGYRFEIQKSGVRQTIDWSGLFRETERDQAFKQLTQMIIDMIEATPSYQALPKANGYYE